MTGKAPLPASARLLSTRSNPALAQAVAGELRVQLAEMSIESFPDGELHVEVHNSVRGSDVYLVAPTCPPAAENIIELLLAVDACHRAGAARITTLVPYFGYARQDRRAGGREAVGARVIADLLGASATHRLLAVDLHAPSLEGFFSIPIEHLTAVPVLARAAMSSLSAESVIVAPDLGSVRLAETYARLLSRPIAIVHKVRISAQEVRAAGVVGSVRGMKPILVDDMVSTGRTIEAAAEALLQAGCDADITCVATHAVLVEKALDRLAASGIRRAVVTDSIPQHRQSPIPLDVVSLAPLLAEAVRRLANNESLRDLIVHG